MYLYGDIPMLIETIQKHQGEQFTLLVDSEILDSSIFTQKLFYAHHELETDLTAIFTTINFLRDVHGYDRSIDDLYILIGRVSEKLYVEGKDIIGLLEGYMSMYLNRAYVSITGKGEITLRDILNLYNIVPIPMKTEHSSGQSL